MILLTSYEEEWKSNVVLSHMQIIVIIWKATLPTNGNRSFRINNVFNITSKHY